MAVLALATSLTWSISCSTLPLGVLGHWGRTLQTPETEELCSSRIMKWCEFHHLSVLVCPSLSPEPGHPIPSPRGVPAG